MAGWLDGWEGKVGSAWFAEWGGGEFVLQDDFYGFDQTWLWGHFTVAKAV